MTWGKRECRVYRHQVQLSCSPSSLVTQFLYHRNSHTYITSTQSTTASQYATYPPQRETNTPDFTTYSQKNEAHIITNEQRHKIILAIANEGDTYSSASKRFKLPYTTVRSIFLTFQKTSRTSKLPRGGNRRPRLEKEHLEWLKVRLLDDPDIPLTDLHGQLNNHFCLKPPVSRSTVQNAVRNRGEYTLKLIHPEPVPYNDPDRVQARKVWAQQVNGRFDSLDDFVYLDESGFNVHIRRKLFRASRAVRPVKLAAAQRGPSMSLVVAVDKTGLLACEIKLKAYKGFQFARFLQNKLFPKLDGPRVIVMDNCRIHKEKTVLSVVQDAHHTPLFLPACTPHLNVAEWGFGCVKGQVKKSKVKKHTLAGLIHRSLMRSVTAANVAEWMKEVERNFLLALEGQPLGRLTNTKQALIQLMESENPYPEVEDDEQEDEQEPSDDGEVLDEGSVRNDNNSSHSSDSDGDEAEKE